MALLLLLLRPILILSLFHFAPIFHSEAALGSVAEEDFSEELLLRPLPDRKVLAHFHFQSRAPHTNSNGRHHHLFPKAISQLVQKFHVKEMELSFTQGRWNYDQWGGFDPLSSSNAKPPGVELWAVFDVPHKQVDDSWKNLTHALSGLFCASINFLESSTAYSAPEWGYRPDSGSLSGLHLTSSEFESEGVGSGIVLEQTLTVVVQPSSQRTVRIYSHETKLQPSWSLTSIFGRKVSGRCVLAKSSIVYLQLDSSLVAELDSLQKENNISSTDKYVSEDFSSNACFEVSVKPDRVLKELKGFEKKNPSVLYEFSIDKYNESGPFDLGLTWTVPVAWSCQKAPLHVSRFLMGSGNERGAIAISLRSTELTNKLLHTDSNEGRCKLEVKVFQVVPWYIKVYFHTLQVFVNEQPQAVSDVVEKMLVSPSVDKVSPGVLEMVLKFPCGMKSAAITLDFDKGFLHIDEYPPDANQGFDIPSAIISFPNFRTSMQFLKDDSSDKSSILSKFEENSAVLAYTEVLLVPLTTPDFSMPYNVITITCTVCALYFGSLLNVLRRRVGEEERLENKEKEPGWLRKLYAKLTGRPLEPVESTSTSSSLSSSKLKFIILVAGIAVFWQVYYG
ncbi:hypothetical protein M0R45_010341 [Rubus argutus]|uniref:GPI transamidase component PIG-T n=1 Tax=Rubus argutus TaxID=59490 RepID=A0AAW1Y6P7_RUBAR